MRTIVTSTSGDVKFEGLEGERVKQHFWHDDDDLRAVVVDMSPQDVLDFIRQYGPCILNYDEPQTLGIEVYDDYRE